MENMQTDNGSNTQQAGWNPRDYTQEEMRNKIQSRGSLLNSVSTPNLAEPKRPSKHCTVNLSECNVYELANMLTAIADQAIALANTQNALSTDLAAAYSSDDKFIMLNCVAITKDDYINHQEALERNLAERHKAIVEKMQVAVENLRPYFTQLDF